LGANFFFPCLSVCLFLPPPFIPIFLFVIFLLFILYVSFLLFWVASFLPFFRQSLS
jgi:hypothetical protein